MMRLKTHIEKQILDACCGSRMFWFDKDHHAAVFMDNRSFGKTLCDGRRFEVRPDLIADFREIPFPDESFRLVVFDPPHLRRAGKSSWLCAGAVSLKAHGRMISAEASRSACAS